jgi:galactose mutarotase-like enzyme
MNPSIHNDILRLSASPNGAEWTSLIDQRDGSERLWQGDPTWWTGQAPVLFPVIGAQTNESIRINGLSYPHPKHGFFRRRVCSVVRHVEDELVFELTSDAQTRIHYPFEFKFRVGFRLEGHTVINEFEVENTGSVPMPFHLGAHPAFHLFGESHLDFDQPETASIFGVTPAGLLTPDSKPYLNNEFRIPITPETFVPDALVFKSLTSKGIELVSEGHPSKIRVEYEDFPYLGIWAKAGAPYVCIEPWIGCADTEGQDVEYAQKEAIVWAASGETRTFRYSVSVISVFS